MNNAQMLAAVLALPDPDYTHASSLDAPIGTGTSYRARTVVLLLEKQRKQQAAILAARAQPLRELSDEEIRKWWASENGLEDVDMCKLDDFTKTVRAVLAAAGGKA